MILGLSALADAASDAEAVAGGLGLLVIADGCFDFLVLVAVEQVVDPGAEGATGDGGQIVGGEGLQVCVFHDGVLFGR